MTTPPRRLVVALGALTVAALAAGCDSYADPTGVRRGDAPGGDPAAGLPAGWSVWTAMAERELVPLARAAESAGHAGALGVEIGGRDAGYRAIVLEKVVVPSGRAGRRETAMCRPHRALLAWRGAPPTEGLFLVGEDFAAPVHHRPPMRCQGAGQPPMPPMLMAVSADVAWPLVAVAGEAHVGEGVAVGACDREALVIAYALGGMATAADCARTAHPVRASAALQRRLPWDSTAPPPPSLLGTLRGAVRSMRIGPTVVPGLRVTVRCDDPAQAGNNQDCGLAP